MRASNAGGKEREDWTREKRRRRRKRKGEKKKATKKKRKEVGRRPDSDVFWSECRRSPKSWIVHRAVPRTFCRGDD